MAHPIGSPDTDELLRRVIGQLQALPEQDRAAKLRHFLSLLDQEAAFQARMISRCTADETPILKKWAVDLGIRDGLQHLAVTMAPGVVSVPKTTSATGIPLVSNGFLGADLLHIPAGEGFLAHRHPGDHLLFVVGGYGTITAGGKVRATAPGEVFIVQGERPHAVSAITDHMLLSIGAPHKAIDSEERQSLTDEASLLNASGSVTCEICGIAATSLNELSKRGCQHVPAG